MYAQIHITAAPIKAPTACFHPIHSKRLWIVTTNLMKLPILLRVSTVLRMSLGYHLLKRSGRPSAIQLPIRLGSGTKLTHYPVFTPDSIYQTGSELERVLTVFLFFLERATTS